MESNSLLVCGLGNPGREYAGTRHNIGAMAVQQTMKSLGLSPKEQFSGQLAVHSHQGMKVYFFVPGCFMNLSGIDIRKCMSFYKISLPELLVIHDELELPYGTIQYRLGGGSGGHNGLRSIDSQCGGKDYHRIRLGIGRPVHGNVSDWVLSRFSVRETPTLSVILEAPGKVLEDCGFKPTGLPTGKIRLFDPPPSR